MKRRYPTQNLGSERMTIASKVAQSTGTATTKPRSPKDMIMEKPNFASTKSLIDNQGLKKKSQNWMVIFAQIRKSEERNGK